MANKIDYSGGARDFPPERREPKGKVHKSAKEMEPLAQEVFSEVEGSTASLSATVSSSKIKKGGGTDIVKNVVGKIKKEFTDYSNEQKLKKEIKQLKGQYETLKKQPEIKESQKEKLRNEIQDMIDALLQENSEVGYLNKCINDLTALENAVSALELQASEGDEVQLEPHTDFALELQATVKGLEEKYTEIKYDIENHCDSKKSIQDRKKNLIFEIAANKENLTQRGEEFGTVFDELSIKVKNLS